MRADLHRSFDDGHWALMPKLAHISRIAGEQKVNDLVRQGGEEGQDLFFMVCTLFLSRDRSSQLTHLQFSTWLGKKVFEYQFLWLGSADYATNPPLLRRRTALPEAPYTPCDGERPEIRDALKRLQIRNAELIADKERLRPKPSGLDEAPTTSNTSNGAYPNLDAMDDAALRKEYATLLAETQDLYLHCAKLESENTHLRMRVADPSQAPLDNTTDPREPHLLDHLTYYRVFGPPYTDLPIIESRVHPFFIIFNAGAKLSGVVNPRKFGLVALQILELYNRWRCPLPSTGLYTGGSNQGGPYDDGQTRTTSQTSDLDGSSVASGSQREGARKSARLLAKEADKAREAKEQTPPRDEDMSPHDSSEGTPSLVHDSSSNAPAPQTWAKTPSPRPPIRSKIGLPTPTLPPPSTRNR